MVSFPKSYSYECRKLHLNRGLLTPKLKLVASFLTKKLSSLYFGGHTLITISFLPSFSLKNGVYINLRLNFPNKFNYLIFGARRENAVDLHHFCQTHIHFPQCSQILSFLENIIHKHLSQRPR